MSGAISTGEGLSQHSARISPGIGRDRPCASEGACHTENDNTILVAIVATTGQRAIQRDIIVIWYAHQHDPLLPRSCPDVGVAVPGIPIPARFHGGKQNRVPVYGGNPQELICAGIMV